MPTPPSNLPPRPLAPGPAAQPPPRRVRPEHYVAASTLVAILGGAKGFTSFSDFAAARERNEVKLEAELKEQGKTLGDVKLTLVEIRAQGAARDAAFDRIAVELGDTAKGQRELEKTLAAASEQLREHDRRLAVIEGRK